MSFAELLLEQIDNYERTGDGSGVKKIVVMATLLKETIQACAEWGINQEEMIYFVGKYGTSALRS